jgi:uncharacterized membrane protein YfhO
VEITCESPASGFAVLVDENAAGWSATVDGAAAPVQTADVLLRAVAVEPGRHTIVLAYRTPWLREGVALSLVAWMTLPSAGRRRVRVTVADRETS